MTAQPTIKPQANEAQTNKTRPGVQAFAAARSMLGCRFRLQGDDPATGLDCVGLIRAAYRKAGIELTGLANYPMRGWSEKKIIDSIDASGLERWAGTHQEGEIVMLRLPARQIHFALQGHDLLIHAHAGLRRVVASPTFALPAPIQRWRVTPTHPQKEAETWQR